MDGPLLWWLAVMGGTLAVLLPLSLMIRTQRETEQRRQVQQRTRQEQRERDQAAEAEAEEAARESEAAARYARHMRNLPMYSFINLAKYAASPLNDVERVALVETVNLLFPDAATSS